MEYSEEERLELAHSTHAGMLHDDERHRKYFQALKRTIRNLKLEGKAIVRVLDIGCGTGILSMMAAKAGADLVTACESFKPMSDIAKKIIYKNKSDEIVNIFGKTSNELVIPQDMAERADILVTEIFDSELIGEGVLPTLRDAHERLLHPNCQVIPSSAALYIQLIESDKLWNMNKMKFDFLHLGQPRSIKCQGWAAAHEIHASQLYPNDLKLMSNVHQVKSFNFHEPFYHAGSSGLKYSVSNMKIHATQEGVIHGVLLWWDLVLHDDGIILSMKPDWVNGDGISPWRDHWMQAVYYLYEPIYVAMKDTIFLTMYHDDYSIWFDVSVETHTEYVDRPLCSCGWHVSCPRERFTMHNHPNVHACYEKLVKRFKNYKESMITIFGDTSLLPLFFSKDGFKKLRYIECASFSKNVVKSLYDSNELNDGIEIVPLNSMQGGNFETDVVICEPYCSSCLLPWQNLQIWQHLDNVRVNNACVKVFPQRALLKAIIVSLDDLWRVREPVKKIEEFDLSDYDTLINDVQSPIEITEHGSFSSVEPYAMWEYGHKIMSDTYILKEFNLAFPFSKELISFTGKMCTSQYGFSNAIVIWMDFELDDGLLFRTGLSENNIWVSYSKQGVYFIKNRVLRETGTCLLYNVLLDTKQWDMLFSFELFNQ